MEIDNISIYSSYSGVQRLYPSKVISDVLFGKRDHLVVSILTDIALSGCSYWATGTHIGGDWRASETE